MFISLVQNAYTCKYTRLTFGARFVLLMLYCLGGIARSCVRKYGVPKQQLNKLHIRTWIIYKISVGDTVNLMDNVFFSLFRGDTYSDSFGLDWQEFLHLQNCYRSSYDV